MIKLLIQVILLSVTFSSIAQGINKTDSLIDLLNNTSNNTSLANLHIEIANAYANTDALEACNYSSKSINFALKTNDTTLIAECYLNASARMLEFGNREEALRLLLKAKNLFEAIGKESKSFSIYNNLAVIYAQANDFNSALSFFRLSEKQAINDNKENLLLFSTNNIGLCLQSLGRTDSALFYFQKTLVMADKHDDTAVKAKVYLNIGQCYIDLNKIDSSLIYLRKAIEYKDLLPNAVICEIFRNTSISLLKQKEFIRSKQLLDSAYLYIEKSNSIEFKKLYYETQYRFDSTIGNYKSAMKYLLLHTQIKDSLNSKDYNENMAKYKSIYDLDIKQNEIEVLKKQNELSVVKSRQKNSLLVFFILLCISLSTIAYLVYRSNKIKHLSIEKLNTTNTELNSTLKELNKTQTQLIHSEKLASIGMLARGAAHEINNPLNYISGGVYLIDELLAEPETNNNSSFKKYINVIKEGIDRIKKIVNALETFSESKNEPRTQININMLTNNTLSMMGSTKLNEIKISKDFQSMPDIEIYSNKLSIALYNILNNAIDAVIDSKEKQMTISTSIESDNVNIKIFNTGKLIPSENKNKIFDPFFTTKHPDKATGVGLAIANNLIKENNGHLSFENKNKGVEFTISLPIWAKNNS